MFLSDNNCPDCNLLGESVNKITVESLVKDEYNPFSENYEYRICKNTSCEIAYYSVPPGIKFLKDQVKVPLWFKNSAIPKYVCYCSKVTEDDVFKAINDHGAKTVKDVCIKTGAMKNPNCIKNNPLGKCCHKSIQKIIDDIL